MKRQLAFFAALIILLTFASCKKDEYEPEQNSLIIRYQDGHAVTQKLDVYIIDKDEPDFTVMGKAKGNPGLDFSVYCNSGGANPVYFDSTGIGTNGIRMTLNHVSDIKYWDATSGRAQVTYIKRAFTDKVVVHFRNVVFTYKDNPDTLIINGFLEATRPNVLDQ